MEFAGACGRGELEEVERLIPLVRDITARGLYEAFHHDEPAVVHRLLEAGADVNGHMPWACWFTPLMHCLRYSEPRWNAGPTGFTANHLKVTAISSGILCHFTAHRGD